MKINIFDKDKGFIIDDDDKLAFVTVPKERIFDCIDNPG